MGRTLLSDAFDVAVDFSNQGQTNFKINFKCVGQECPTHTWHERDARAYIGV